MPQKTHTNFGLLSFIRTLTVKSLLEGTLQALQDIGCDTDLLLTGHYYENSFMDVFLLYTQMFQVAHRCSCHQTVSHKTSLIQNCLLMCKPSLHKFILGNYHLKSQKREIWQGAPWVK